MNTLIVLSLLVLIGCGWYYNLTSYQAGENKEKSPWRKLASVKNLVFEPARHLSANAFVTGNYRGYHLELTTYKQERVHTSLLLSPLSFPDPYLPFNPNINLENPPTAKDISKFLMPRDSCHQLKGQFKVKPKAKEIYYEQVGFETDEQYLLFVFDLLADLGNAYIHLILLGGEVIPALREISDQAGHYLAVTAKQLLEDIAQDTTDRLAERASSILCPQCLTTFASHPIHPSSRLSRVYYGCRTCGQSRTFLEDIRVIAVLDRQQSPEQVKQYGVLRVNWLTYHRLFDFDEVNIVDASEEEIERFAVQVGNDTDAVRKPRYKKVLCRVRPDLSENSRRILDKIFGQVVVETTV